MTGIFRVKRCCAGAAVFFAVLVLGAGMAAGRVITREQELETRARTLYEKGLAESLRGDTEGALRRFEAVVKAYPRSSVAVLAQWEVVRLNEVSAEPVAAFDALQLLVEHYPGNFEKALRKQFEIALRQLTRYDQMLRLPDPVHPKDLPKREQVSAMLRIVIENGPYADNVAEACYYLGVALEKEGKIPQAAIQHETFFERFPSHPLADDSAYQVAYILYKAWRKMKGWAPANRERAEMAMQWFLVRYPESDKAAQAQGCLAEIRQAEQRELASLAEFYEARGNERAAAIYHRELAARFPELAPEGSALRNKVLALMEKYPQMKGQPDQGPPLNLLPDFTRDSPLPDTLKADVIFEFGDVE